VAEGEAEGEADSSAAAFFFVVFFGEADGDASVEADVEAFFVVEVFLAVVDLAWVVVVPVVVAAVSSFFCDWQELKNAAIASAVIKDNIFIGLVKLNKGRECRSSRPRASTKIGPFFFLISTFSCLIRP
jgi:hypothetical protein